MNPANTTLPEIEKPASPGAESGPVHRALNVRFLVVSLVLFGILAGALYQVRAWQVSRTAVALLTRADQLEKEEKWFDAAENIQRYVQLVPLADLERIRLATVYEKGVKKPAERERAIGLYYRAIGTGLQDQQVPLRRKVTRLLLQNRRYFEARAEAEKLLAALPGDPEALEMRALALWGQWQTKSLAREGIDRRPDSIAEEGTNLVIIALEDAREANPENIELCVALATAYRDQELKAFAKSDRSRAPGESTRELELELKETERVALADGCLNDLVKARRDDAEALLARHLYRARWHAHSIGKDIETAALLAPENPDVLYAAANAARAESRRLRSERIRTKKGAPEDEVRQLEKARDNYLNCVNALGKDEERLRARAGLDETARLALGEMELALGNRDAAIEAWTKGLEAYLSEPSALEFQTRIASARIEEGQFAKAEASLQQMKASIQAMLQKLPREAVRALELEYDLRNGLLHLRQNKPNLAIPCLQRVVAGQEQLGGRSERSVQALLLLGNAFASTGDWTRSAESYDQAVLQEPNLEMALVAASTSWLAANAIDAAVERAEQAVRITAVEPTCRGWFALASALLRQQLLLAPADRVWSRLDQALLAARQAADDSTLAEPWRIELLLADAALGREDGSKSPQQRQAEALAILRQAEAKYPQAVELWEALPTAYQRLGAPADADRAADRLAQLPGGAPKAALLKTRLLAMRGDYEGAQQALLAADQGGADSAAVEQELLNLKFAQKDLAAVRKQLTTAHKQSPQDLNVLRRLADIDFEAREFKAVQTWESAMDECGPGGKALALYFKIRRRLVEAKSSQDSAFLAAVEDHTRLLALRPNWHEAVALGGLIEESQGHAEQAIQAYERAIGLGEQRVAIFERLIGLLNGVNRMEEAEKYLSRMHSPVSVSQSLTEFASNAERSRNQIDEAIEFARNGIRARPQDAQAHVWLGRMLLQKKLDAEAEASFREAVKLQSDDVRTWNALFDFCLRSGKTEEARSILGEIARQARLKPAELDFVLAQGHEMLGDREQAAAAYDKAVAADPQNPTILLRVAGFYRGTNIDKSVELARQAQQNAPNLPLARQTLAALLSDRGREEDWEEIDGLVSHASRDAVSAPRDNRFRAILLIRKGGAKNLQESVDILEELTSEGQKDEDYILLAQIYERQARLAETPAAARELLEKSYNAFARLADRATAQPPHVMALVEFSLRHQRAKDAEKGLAKLAKLLDPANKPAPQLLAEFVRLSLLQGNTAQADQFLKILEEQQPDALSCIVLRTRLLEKQGKSAEVGAFVEESAQRLLAKVSRPEEKAAVHQGIGDLYASLKRMPLAEKWYEQLLAVAPARFDRLVMAHVEQGKIAAALKVCRNQSEAKNTLPAALLAVNVLASGKASDSEVKEGEALISAGLKDNADKLQLLAAVATLRVIQGASDAAESMFAEMVKKNGRDPLALNNLATLLAEKEGQRDEALKLIDKALLIAGPEPSLLDTKGTILLFKGEAERALANLEAATREPDADPRYRFHLALAYRDLKRAENAKSELQRAIDRDLEKQILTTRERELLAELRTQLSL